MSPTILKLLAFAGIKVNASAPCSAKCAECGAEHDPREPHDLSVKFIESFWAKHQRQATWTDAMAHCAPRVKACAREAIVVGCAFSGEPIPADVAGGDGAQQMDGWRVRGSNVQPG